MYYCSWSKAVPAIHFVRPLEVSAAAGISGFSTGKELSALNMAEDIRVGRSQKLLLYTLCPPTGSVHSCRHPGVSTGIELSALNVADDIRVSRSQSHS